MLPPYPGDAVREVILCADSIPLGVVFSLRRR